MISLVLATFCSASIAILFKISSEKKLNSQVVTVMNYLTASMVSLALIINSKSTNIDYNRIDFRHALLLGFMTGVLFLTSFVIYQKSVSKNGASLSGMFAKLGILVPMLVSIVIWSEFPTFVQTLGIVVAILAIGIVNLKSEKHSNAVLSIPLLLSLFLAGGVAEFLNKVFQKSASMDYKPVFLFVVFTTALLLSLILMLRQGRKRDRKLNDVIMGVLVGVPNLFSSFFLLDALDVFPAAIVFPTYSAGSILIITIISVLFFKEKLLSKDKLAIGFTAIGLVLMNI